MSRSRFAATQLTSTQAHDVWANSNEGSAFTRPDYLERLVDEVEWWGVQVGDEVVAAWPVVRPVAGGEIGPPAFCYYIGPMFAARRYTQKYSRHWADYINSFSALADALPTAYPSFKFALPLGVQDVRPLEWWNFEHPGKSAYAVRPRYTARIDLSEFGCAESLFQSFAGDRRRDIRRWSKQPPSLVTDVPARRIIELHDSALQRNGTLVTRERHIALERIIALVQSGAGSVLGMIPHESGEIEAAIVLLHGHDESNNVLCVASNAWRREGLTAWTVWQGLEHARSIGKRWFDFNGANSPLRAADKHLYGAKTALYFDGSFDAK